MASMYDDRSERIPPGREGLDGRSAAGGADTGRSVDVLLVGGPHTEQAMRRVFANSNWMLETARSTEDALERLRERPKAVVICEDGCMAGTAETWGGLLALTRKLASPPKVIVASAEPDDRLWAEVLHQGGYDVLPLPLEAPEALHMVSMAWLEWRHEREGSPAVAAARAMAVAAS